MKGYTTMNKLSLFIIAIALFAFVGCSKKQEGSQADAVTVETTAIKVETIQCDMCVSNITKALEQTDGVQSVKVDLKEKVATVQFLPAKLNLAALEQTISNAGYDANNTKRNMEAYEKLDDCCKIDGGH